MSDRRGGTGVPVWLFTGVVLAFAAAVIGIAARNAQGDKRYRQLVSAVGDLIDQGRAKAEDAAEVIGETGADIAKDLRRGAKKAKRRLT